MHDGALGNKSRGSPFVTWSLSTPGLRAIWPSRQEKLGGPVLSVRSPCGNIPAQYRTRNFSTLSIPQDIGRHGHQSREGRGAELARKEVACPQRAIERARQSVPLHSAHTETKTGRGEMQTEAQTHTATALGPRLRQEGEGRRQQVACFRIPPIGQRSR